MKPLGLHKSEKLCSEKAIAALFTSDGDASAAIAYPLRAVWRVNPVRSQQHDYACPQFMIVVPKKRLRRAVDRVQMRRRIREAYRLNRHLFPRDVALDINFVYVSDEVKGYHRIHTAMTRLLTKINLSLTSPLSAEDDGTPD